MGHETLRYWLSGLCILFGLCCFMAILLALAGVG
jgi:hypothetical protein